MQILNSLLAPHGLHFGYRVFDKVVTFLEHAERNAMFREVDGEDPAFDAVVLMKVLPKFHGSRGKREAPLRALLAWCLIPDDPNPATIGSALQDAGFDATPSQALRAFPYRLPRTATRALRMLDDLHRDGFTSFG